MFSFNKYCLLLAGGGQGNHFFTLYCIKVWAENVIGCFEILDIVSSFRAHVVQQQDRILFPCWNLIKSSWPGQSPSAWPKHLGHCSYTCRRCFWMKMMAWVSDCWMPCIWHSTFHVNSGENREGLHDYTFTNQEILVSKHPPHN